jgi:hypothetical protein
MEEPAAMKTPEFQAMLTAAAVRRPPRLTLCDPDRSTRQALLAVCGSPTMLG